MAREAKVLWHVVLRCYGTWGYQVPELQHGAAGVKPFHRHRARVRAAKSKPFPLAVRFVPAMRLLPFVLALSRTLLFASFCIHSPPPPQFPTRDLYRESWRPCEPCGTKDALFRLDAVVRGRNSKEEVSVMDCNGVLANSRSSVLLGSLAFFANPVSNSQLSATNLCATTQALHRLLPVVSTFTTLFWSRATRAPSAVRDISVKGVAEAKRKLGASLT
eukprot:160072-Rhodomonas_salina.1